MFLVLGASFALAHAIIGACTTRVKLIEVVDPSYLWNLRALHGGLMSLAWGVMLPAGVGLSIPLSNSRPLQDIQMPAQSSTDANNFPPRHPSRVRPSFLACFLGQVVRSWQWHNMTWQPHYPPLTPTALITSGPSPGWWWRGCTRTGTPSGSPPTRSSKPSERFSPSPDTSWVGPGKITSCHVIHRVLIAFYTLVS